MESRLQLRPVVFVMTGACATPGGIATENRHLLRVLARLSEERRLGVTVLSFLEGNEDRAPFLPEAVGFRGFAGSKLRLALALWRHMLKRPVFIFDHVTLAKPLLPLVVMRIIRAVILAHGSESWKRLRPSSRWLLESRSQVFSSTAYDASVDFCRSRSR